MNELREIHRSTVADREAFTGDTVRNLRTAREFIAEIEEIQDVEMNTELGRDAREALLIHTRDRAAAMELKLNDRIEALGVTLIVLRREDNPAKVQIEFGCMKAN